MDQIDILIRLSGVDSPFTAAEAKLNQRDRELLLAEGMIEMPKQDPTRHVEGKRGRPANQYRLSGKAKKKVGRVKEKAISKKMVETGMPAKKAEAKT